MLLIGGLNLRARGQMENLFYITLVSGPRAYVLTWTTTGLLASIIASAPATSSVAQEATPTPPSPSSSLLFRLTFQPWLGSWRALQSASRGFPALSSPYFLLPAASLVGVLLLPMGAGSLRRAAGALLGLHLLQVERQEAESSGRRSIALPAALGFLGVLLLARSSNCLLPPPVVVQAAEASTATFNTPWLSWLPEGMGATATRTMQEGLHHTAKFAKAAEVGLSLMGAPIPVGAIVEGAQGLVGVKKEEEKTLTPEVFRALLWENTWGELALRGPFFASVVGGCAALATLTLLSAKNGR